MAGIRKGGGWILLFYFPLFAIRKAQIIKENEYNLALINNMTFFTSSIMTLKTLVIALGAGLGVWGVINLLEGYGNDNPGANAHVT